ncbi:41931_t:CDS:1, partial [Gigaspora margarita]
ALQQSCKNTSLISPPWHLICRTTSFDTPSSKNKKGALQAIRILQTMQKEAKI